VNFRRASSVPFVIFVTLVVAVVVVPALFPVFVIRAAAPPAPNLSVADQNTLVARNCAVCHDDDAKTGGLSLEHFDAAKAEQNAAVAEKMIRKLRAGMMPPPLVADRPDEAMLKAFAGSLEARIDLAAAAAPNPGWRPFQRLNRAEYARAVHDLLAVDVDVTAFLPPDTLSSGFDNVSDAQSFSATLLEGYLRAASQISRLAVGDRAATASAATYRVAENTSQYQHVEGAPFGTRGGVSVVHTFPADGSYVVKVELHRTSTGELFGNTALAISAKNEPIEISVNGDRVATLEVTPKMSEADKNGLTLETPPIHVNAGPQRISAAFVQRFAGPIDDLLAPIDRTLADSRIGTGFGITALPHLQDMTIVGPLAVTGISETPSRRKIFSCRPASASDQAACAAEIIRRLTSQAYRSPSSGSDIELLTKLYQQGRNEEGDFESGIRLAVQGILANPKFLFRVEHAPHALRAGQIYQLNDLDLASRVSFFLWDTVPDAELVKAATSGALGAPGGLEKQVRRMLADPRAEALGTRFAAQWLRLQDVDKIRPDALLYPYWDLSLSDAFRRETELFFSSIVRDDKSVLDLLTADYSYINERIARHYGIPNVTGDQFRRVTMPENRRGILSHGSILQLTSVADRTSPVQRGKWIMQVLFGTPPPPPPPNVPLLEETRGAAGSRVLSVRERMEEHRSNPACMSCHRMIDPLGLALENYDVTGKWRIKDNGVPVDAAGVMYDGTKIDGPAGLRVAVLKHSDMFVRTFTESLMTYAIGRRVEYYDMPTVRAIARDAEQKGNRISSFILGVVNSPAFRTAKAEPTTTEAAR
jgi:mono/diheme cytochrome c family protein